MEKIPYETAFPYDYTQHSDSGISILDYFAAAALPVMIEKADPGLIPEGREVSDVIAENCYVMARSMMKERLKHQ